MQKKIKELLEFGEKLLGIKYGWWMDGPTQKEEPMWVRNEKVPKIEEIKSVNCTGFLNLIHRKLGIKIPKHATLEMYDGGTSAYFSHFKEISGKFDKNTKYKAGTLIGRNFYSVKDQGHVAIVLEDQYVLQSIPGEGVNKKYTVQQSNGNGYYEYAVEPQNWLI